MTIAAILLIFMLGAIGAFLSAMLGIGGAIINFPLLLYIPPLFNLEPFTAYEVSGIVAVQVFFSTLGGVYAFRKDDYLNKSLIILMGISSLVGSLIGSVVSSYIAENGINLVYGILALLAAILMFIPRKQIKVKKGEKINYNKLLATVLAFLIGIAAGIVGAGGAFLLIPIMLVVLHIPTRMTIASSLGIAFLSSIGSMIGKVATGQVPYKAAVIVAIASIIASQFGVKLGKKMDVKVLRVMLAIFITVTAIKIWLDLLL